MHKARALRVVLVYFCFFSVFVSASSVESELGQVTNDSLILRKLFSQVDGFVATIDKKLKDPDRFLAGILDMHLLLERVSAQDNLGLKKPLKKLLKQAQRSVDQSSFLKFRDEVKDFAISYKKVVDKGEFPKVVSFFPDYKLFMANIDTELANKETFFDGLKDLYLALEHDAVEKSAQARADFVKKIRKAKSYAVSYQVDLDYVKEILEKALLMSRSGAPVWPKNEGKTVFKLQDLLTKVSSEQEISVSQGLESEVESATQEDAADEVPSRGFVSDNPEDFELFADSYADLSVNYDGKQQGKKASVKKKSSKRAPGNKKVTKKKAKLSVSTQGGELDREKVGPRSKKKPAISPSVESEVVAEEPVTQDEQVTTVSSGRKKKKVSGKKPLVVLAEVQPSGIVIKRKKKEPLLPQESEKPAVLTPQQIHGPLRG